MGKEQKECGKYTWMPSIKWTLKVLAVIYAVVIIVYLSLNILLKPYIRDIPSELTPWLDKTYKTDPEQK